MKILVCDKCGKQYNMPTPTQNAKVPMYKISKLNSLMFPAWEDVDLCSDCEEKFAEWLKGDEDE
jgi:hypothetical protein